MFLQLLKSYNMLYNSIILNLLICNLLFVSSWIVTQKHVNTHLTLVYIHGGNDARLSHYDAVDLCRLLPKYPEVLDPIVAKNATNSGINLKAYMDVMTTKVNSGANSGDTTTTTTTTTTTPSPTTTPSTTTAAPVTTPTTTSSTTTTTAATTTTSTTSTIRTTAEKPPTLSTSNNSTLSGSSHKNQKKRNTYSGEGGSTNLNDNYVLHGDLLSVHSPAMIHILMGWTLSVEARQFWIGGLVKLIQHEFNGQDRHLIQTWTDRTPVTIRFLHHHNPLVNRLHPNEIACVSVDYASGKWGVHYCNEQKYFVCELIRLPKRRTTTITHEGQHNNMTTSTTSEGEKKEKKKTNYLQSSKITDLSKLFTNKTQNMTTGTNTSHTLHEVPSTTTSTTATTSTPATSLTTTTRSTTNHRAE